MTIKEEAKILEDMIDPDSIMDFENDETLIDKSCSDMVILDTVKKKEILEAPDAKQDMIDDYHYARDTYQAMIEQGQEVLTGILEMTASAPNPRAFEVAGQHMKIISDNADKLMKLSKEYRELNTETKSGMDQTADVINNNNIVFNGTTEELLDMLDQEDDGILEIEE